MEITAKEKSIKDDQNSHELIEQKLAMIETENEELYEELNEANNERQKWKEQCEHTEMKLESLKTGLTEMLLAQERVASAARKCEDMVKLQSDVLT